MAMDESSASEGKLIAGSFAKHKQELSFRNVPTVADVV